MSSTTTPANTPATGPAVNRALAAVADAAASPSRHRAAICDEIDHRANQLTAFRNLEGRSDAALLQSVHSHLRLAEASIGHRDLVATRKWIVDAAAELSELVRRTDLRAGREQAARLAASAPARSGGWAPMAAGLRPDGERAGAADGPDGPAGQDKAATR